MKKELQTNMKRPPGATLAGSTPTSRLAAAAPRPTVHIPAVTAPDGAGGWNIKPGKPMVLTSADEITTAEAARLLGYSQGWISHLCDEGEFKTARKKGPGPRSMWMIQRAEVLAFVFQRTE